MEFIDDGKSNKPPYLKCHGECKKILPFTEEFFNTRCDNKYKSHLTCKICKAKKRQEVSYNISYLKSLPKEDKAKLSIKGITVLCRYCGTRFAPTIKQLKHRRDAVNGIDSGGNFFYCCDKCKEDCPDFNFNINGIHPLSDLYNGKDITKFVRSCAKSSKKAIMDWQMDEYGFHYCEVCGIKHEKHHMPMELHHTDEVAKCGKKAITSAGHMITCYTCHKKITKGTLST